MTILDPGPLGRTRGKIGNMVFYPIKINIVGRLIGKQDKKPTPMQSANRQAIPVTIATAMLKPLKTFI